MAQAMAPARGFSTPAFSLPAGLPPLHCPLPGEGQGQNPRITTATAVLSVLVHAAVVLGLLRLPLPSAPDAAVPSAFPAVALTWEAPVMPPAPVSSVADPVSFSEPVADPAPPAPAPPVLMSVAPVAPAVPVLERTAPARTVPKPPKKAPAPKPPVSPVSPVSPASPVSPVPVEAAAPAVAAAAPSAAPVSTPVTPEPSLLRGEDGIPVSRDARYLEPPTPPEYPRRAVQLGLEGTVVVRALVEGGGVPRTVRIVTGSGVDSLDAAAVRAVSGWKFAVSDHGSLWVEIPVQFRLR